ncbi:MAG: hypothetical protein JSV12_05105 [Candidatus Bathyarchaeota archaeon]|nr:MAG: hypothetical protein JSV12_05105 [Candidatus Bathyarchaeota archaeon]
MISKTEIPNFTLLLIGVILLVFAFFNAYSFLQKDLSIVSTSGIENLFGEALGPLIEASIRVMYLGIMGWIGSIVTIRGVQLLTSPKPETVPKIEPVKQSSKNSGHSSAKTKGKKSK